MRQQIERQRRVVEGLAQRRDQLESGGQAEPTDAGTGTAPAAATAAVTAGDSAGQAAAVGTPATYAPTAYGGAGNSIEARDPQLRENQLRDQMDAQLARIRELEAQRDQASNQYLQSYAGQAAREQSDALNRQVLADQLREQIARIKGSLGSLQLRSQQLRDQNIPTDEDARVGIEYANQSAQLQNLEGQLRDVELRSRIASAERNESDRWNESATHADIRDAYEAQRQAAIARYQDLGQQLEDERRQQAGQVEAAGQLDQEYRLQRAQLQELEARFQSAVQADAAASAASAASAPRAGSSPAPATHTSADAGENEPSARR